MRSLQNMPEMKTSGIADPEYDIEQTRQNLYIGTHTVYGHKTRLRTSLFFPCPSGDYSAITVEDWSIIKANPLCLNAKRPGGKHLFLSEEYLVK